MMFIMFDEEQIFKALSDSTRRFLLDLLFESDGQTLSELESKVPMTRFGVMKHLRILETAGLVISRREGREKMHFLNAVPIRLIHNRWIDKFTERQVSALANLKTTLEKNKWNPTRKRESPRRFTKSICGRLRRLSGVRSPRLSGPANMDIVHGRLD